MTKRRQKKRQRIIEMVLLVSVVIGIGCIGMDGQLKNSNVHAIEYTPPIKNINQNVLPKNEDKKNLSVQEQIKKIARDECNKKGIGNYCINDLIAMAWVESRFDKKAIGDNGASHGCYQIHQGYHKHITQEQAENLNFAINWTLNRLIAKGYPKYRSIAIMSHNGTPNTQKTLSYLASVNNYFNN